MSHGLIRILDPTKMIKKESTLLFITIVSYPKDGRAWKKILNGFQ